MDFVEGGTLKDYIATFGIDDDGMIIIPEKRTTFRIMLGVARGLEYLHTREPMPILHRDIKSENILLTAELEPRIADLGEARVMQDRTMTQVGTRGYTAPEVLRGEHYGRAADVFSFSIGGLKEIGAKRIAFFFSPSPPPPTPPPPHPSHGRTPHNDCTLLRFGHRMAAHRRNDEKLGTPPDPPIGAADGYFNPAQELLGKRPSASPLHERRRGTAPADAQKCV